MNKKRIEQALKNAVANATPDVLDNILSHCGKQDGKELKIKMKSNKKVIKAIVAVAAAFAIIIGGLAVFNLTNKEPKYIVHSTVTFDVNPSIEILLTEDEKVIDIKALNDAARVVLEGKNYKADPLDKTVDDLIASIVKRGYLDEYSNSILISVDSKSEADGKTLEQKLNHNVKSLLNYDNFSGAVLSQTVKHNEYIDEMAQKHAITVGKAQLINAIVSSDSRYTFEQLVPLTINELNLISRSGEMISAEVNANGTASNKGYINAEDAKKIALDYSGISEEEYSNNAWYWFNIYENGEFNYEVSLYYNDFEYKYYIDAKSGEIIKGERINDTDSSSNTAVTFKEEVFEHFGLTYDDFVKKYGKETNRGWDRGALFCEFENGVGKYAFRCDYDETNKEFFITGNDKCYALHLDAKYVFDNFDEKIAITDLGIGVNCEISTSFNEMEGEGYLSTFKYNEYTVMFNTDDKRFIEEDTEIAIVIK